MVAFSTSTERPGSGESRALKQAGGWQHDTLTEDLDLSYRAQLAGWKFIFLPDVVTPAELPVDMNGFKSQQHRWTKGSIQTCKKLLPEILAEQAADADQAGGDRPSCFQFRISASRLSWCVLLHPSTGGPQSGWVRTLLIDVPIFPDRFRLGRSLLHLRAARTASADLDEGNHAFALPARAWGRLIAK